jgi:sRNA-binding regulator protein Hfq
LVRLEEKSMAENTATKGKSPAPEKFRAHGVQSEWLNSAKGKSVEVTLDSGQVLSGRLVGHDIYCLALDEAGQEGDTLIYKQSISFVRFSKEE